jgi:membrane-associated HD superfamily phosphohydrolase
MKASIVAIAAMGLLRFVLDAGGVPREIVKYFSMTAVIIACFVYFAIATTTHKKRLKAAYSLVMPYMAVEVIALSYTWATGRYTIFSAAEYSLGYSTPLHTIGHLVGGLTWEPLLGFLMMEIISFAYVRSRSFLKTSAA